MKYLWIFVFAMAHCYGATILNQINQGDHPHLSVGGANWVNVTNLIDNSSQDFQKIADFSSLTPSSGDALWIDQERNGTFTSTEIDNVRDFISSGHRAIIMGENAVGFAGWNPVVMSIVGGESGSGCISQFHASLVSHELLAGVSGINTGCAGSINPAVGDVEVLFAGNIGAVYQVGEGEALVLMDSNIFDDARLNTTFANNVLDWLGQPLTNSGTIPEPGTYFLGLSTFLFLGCIRKRIELS